MSRWGSSYSSNNNIVYSKRVAGPQVLSLTLTYLKGVDGPQILSLTLTYLKRVDRPQVTGALLLEQVKSPTEPKKPFPIRLCHVTIQKESYVLLLLLDKIVKAWIFWSILNHT